MSLYTGILVFITKKEILPLVTTQMNLEHVLLHEISQTQEGILDDMTHVESKKAKLREAEEWWLPGPGGGGGAGMGWGGVGQRVQSFSYARRRTPGSNVQEGD